MIDMKKDRQFKMILVDDSPTLGQYRRTAKSYFKNRNRNPLILGSINPAKDHWVTEYLKDNDNERL